jgi:hypothetical protein
MAAANAGHFPYGTADVKDEAILLGTMRPTSLAFAVAFAAGGISRRGRRRGVPTFAALCALALVSGCLTSPATPNGTTTPTPDINATTTTPTWTTSTTPSTPGTPTEPTAPTHPGGGMLVRPAHEENVTDGFRLVGDESASGIYPPGSATFTFVGTNEGAAAEALFDPCGAGNPRIWIEDENGTKLSLEPPRMHCMAAMGFGPIGHNETRAANLTWNGTAYHGDQAYTAPPGLYHVISIFEARRDNAIVDVKVSLPLSIVSQPGVL